MLFTHKYFSGRVALLRRPNFLKAERQPGPTDFDSGNKKAPTHEEKGRQNGCASLLIFPGLMMPGLELAPDIEIEFNRLPWCHRASPSTTRHESVKSTDADKLMLERQCVNRFFSREDAPRIPSA
jgi:hypothetical protein